MNGRIVKKSSTIFTVVAVLALGGYAYAHMGHTTWSHYGNMYGHATNFRGAVGPQHYPPFEVDTSQDIFVNPHRFGEFTGGMDFVDEDGDGIGDIFQNTELYRGLGIGPWMDKNEDGIGDIFQSIEIYRLLGMDNFVDVDGDGLCDNYELHPMDF